MIAAKFSLPERYLRRIFEIGVIIKGLDGALETIGGVLLFFISTARLNSLVVLLTQHELSEDPQDLLATHVVSFFAHFIAGARLFPELYLISHGLIKFFLVWGLLRNKLWAYPASIAVLTAFIFYQVYRYTFTHAISLVLLTVFDAVIVALTWHEYGLMKQYKQNVS
jgi:uncharacterized membrane protein